VSEDVVAFVPDLMDRSKVAAAGAVTFVQSAEDLRGRDADLVIVDLSRPGVLEVLGSIASSKIVGFASHVDRPLLEAARAAGCTEVMARSAFFSRLADLLAPPR
jgi:hypothetical protein